MILRPLAAQGRRNIKESFSGLRRDADSNQKVRSYTNRQEKHSRRHTCSCIKSCERLSYIHLESIETLHVIWILATSYISSLWRRRASMCRTKCLCDGCSHGNNVFMMITFISQMNLVVKVFLLCANRRADEETGTDNERLSWTLKRLF